ncbi:ABC transporter permease [Edaphobacter albus]|uniref:ABC transporter permease n=1 Tax=Edaphobacter sp. 4G125 TaxID=2763071 RepID=UPI001645F19A|nr:ABC transporter permease [Edaphobacter sp. 4G125]QNI37574.1 ABC transporter permease [Edaphobacter sp. 4G125]
MRRFFFRKRIDEELQREIDEHIEMERDLNLERGLSGEEATRQALIKFGSRQRVREDIWKRNSVTFFEKLRRDLSYAIRTLLRGPGYTILAVITLALGIGANTAIFTVINGVLLRPLPYSNPSQIVHLEQTATRVGRDRIGFSVQEVLDYRQQSQSFSDLAEYHSMTFTLLGAKVPERVVTGVVSANYFDVLGVKPVLGRLIHPSDEKLNAPPVLVLSYAYWVKEFGADPKILGRPFTMNDRVHTVIGVLPPLPEFPDANDVYMPTTSCPFRSSPGMIANRDARALTVLARLKPGVTLTQARADLNTIGNRLALSYPRSYPPAAGLAMKITPLQQEMTHAARPTLLMLLGASGMVLLLACANLANLALSRQLRRSRETAIRIASGATAWDIFRQMLVESITVALTGGVLGLGIAMATTRALVSYAARMTPLATDIHLDSRVLLFSLVVALIAGVLFGSIPGFIASRVRLSLITGSGGRTTGSESATRMRHMLVVAQVAFSFVLLVGAGLMMRSLYNLLSVDPGFKTAEVLSMNLPLNWTKYADLKTQNTFFQQILDRVQQIPGAQTVALSSTVPLNDADGGMNGGITIESRPIVPGEPLPQVDHQLSTPDYFRVLGVPMLSGRTFTDADTIDSALVAIVNAQMAQHYWPHLNPVGRRVSTDEGKTWTTIVGVVSSVHQYGLGQDFRDVIYFPQSQVTFMGDPSLLIRTRGEPMLLANQVAAIVHQIDPQQPLTEVRTIDQLRNAQLGTPRVTSILLGTFAGFALFITVVGVTGTLGLSVTRRTKEIGIRIALGATRREILFNVLRNGMAPVVIGIAIGAIGATLSTSVLSSMLFGVKPHDWVTPTTIAFLLAIVALVGCLIPGRRAVRIDPMQALRSE